MMKWDYLDYFGQPNLITRVLKNGRGRQKSGLERRHTGRIWPPMVAFEDGEGGHKARSVSSPSKPEPQSYNPKELNSVTNQNEQESALEALERTGTADTLILPSETQLDF